MEYTFQKRLGQYVLAAQTIFEQEGRSDIAKLLEVARFDLRVKTGYDNWDGGQTLHTLTVTVPIQLFGPISNSLGEVSQQIMNKINAVSGDATNESLEIVSILPEIDSVSNLRGSIPLAEGMIVRTLFDSYTIDKEIGKGGNGRVYSAKSSDNRQVAIKFLERYESNTKVKRFKNEIHFCEVSEHPNIVKILDRGLVKFGRNEYGFYVMPCYGETLRQKMKKGISPEVGIQILIGLLNGLKYAHEHKVIHRDIKPENVLFASSSDEPIICDFGIAHFSLEDMETVVVTKPSDRMANFQYAAPEQRLRGGKISPQTDIYAVALILNEMFTGEIPSAEGYKKIADVVPAYSWLDDIFRLLFKQVPEERLYPEEKIFTELKIRADRAKNERAVQHLADVVIGTEVLEFQGLRIIAKTYKDGCLIFTLDHKIVAEWFSILCQGHYNYSAISGYEPHRLIQIDDKTIGMSVPTVDAETYALQIVGHVQGWIDCANGMYVAQLTARNRQVQREREDARKREIARLESENRVLAMLS